MSWFVISIETERKSNVEQQRGFKTSKNYSKGFHFIRKTNIVVPSISAWKYGADLIIDTSQVWNIIGLDPPEMFYFLLTTPHSIDVLIESSALISEPGRSTRCRRWLNNHQIIYLLRCYFTNDDMKSNHIWYQRLSVVDIFCLHR